MAAIWAPRSGAMAGIGRSALGLDATMRPAKGIDQRRESLANGGASLLLQATRPGPVITLNDPEAGDTISVVPLLTAGAGIADGAAWPDFRVLPSFQGVVVVLISDRTRVEALPNGVVVTTDGQPGGGPARWRPSRFPKPSHRRPSQGLLLPHSKRRWRRPPGPRRRPPMRATRGARARLRRSLASSTSRAGAGAARRISPAMKRR